MLAGRDAGLGIIEQVGHGCLDEHRLQFGHCQQLFPRHPRETGVCGLCLDLPSRLSVGLDHADDLVVWRAAVDTKLRRMAMLHANLPDPDWRGTSSGLGGEGLGGHCRHRRCFEEPSA